MTTDALDDHRPSRTVTSRGFARKYVVHAVMVLLSLVSIFPVYWMIVTSLRPDNEIFSTMLWPSHPTFENYIFVLTRVPMLQMLFNTTVVSVATAFLQVVTGMFAAYALVRWRMRFSSVVHGLIALSWLVPFQVTMIPNYVLASRLGLLDTLTGLVVPNASHAFAILLLYHAMRAFPIEVLEAARMDGARSFRILWQIVTPNMGAPIASPGNTAVPAPISRRSVWARRRSPASNSGCAADSCSDVSCGRAFSPVYEAEICRCRSSCVHSSNRQRRGRSRALRYVGRGCRAVRSWLRRLPLIV